MVVPRSACNMTTATLLRRGLTHGRSSTSKRQVPFFSKHANATVSMRFTSSAPPSVLSPDRLQAFREKGFIDENGLTLFDTLHEMQVRACQVYAADDLFGTYSPDSKKFEWMTYHDYDVKVQTCRTMLKDLGT